MVFSSCKKQLSFHIKFIFNISFKILKAMLEHLDKTEFTLLNSLLTQVFEEEIINSNFDKFLSFLKHGEIVTFFYYFK